MDQAVRKIFPHQKIAYSAIVILWAASKTKDLASIVNRISPHSFQSRIARYNINECNGRV